MVETLVVETLVANSLVVWDDAGDHSLTTQNQSSSLWFLFFIFSLQL